MILVDTSVWVDHFREPDQALSLQILESRIVQHPFVTGELAVGNLNPRARTIELLRCVPQLEVASDDAFHTFTTDRKLAGCGLGFVDIHLLAATMQSGVRLWTRDRRLFDQADILGIAFAE